MNESLRYVLANLSRGIYGNRAEVTARVQQWGNESEQLAFYSHPLARELLTDLPDDEHAERIADCLNN